jgi:hypothetical protein
MNVSKPARRPAEPSREQKLGANFGPMPRQDIFDAHGHDMHPQKLVRLIGCHDGGAEAGDHTPLG